MPARLALVPSNPAAPAFVRSRTLDRALACFEPRLAPRITLLARRHPALADLALSFPALLFALAAPRFRFDPQPLIERVIAGDRLDCLARDAGVAGWLRPLPPEAFRQPLPVLPDSPSLRLRLSNHRPRSPRQAARWLDSVATAFEAADEDVAVWIAAELTGRAGTIANLQRICLWAWLSRRRVPLHERLMTSGHWSPDITISAARDRSYGWIVNLQAAIDLGFDPPSARATPASIVVYGHQFIPLLKGSDLSAEADAMSNCVRGYADAITERRCRLWSVRRDGVRVATLETSVADGEPWSRIVQLKARANTPAPLAVWQAARAFLEAQDANPAWSTLPQPRPAEEKQRTWLAHWRPYWLAKRRIPEWLPATYRDGWWL